MEVVLDQSKLDARPVTVLMLLTILRKEIEMRGGNKLGAKNKHLLRVSE